MKVTIPPEVVDLVKTYEFLEKNAWWLANTLESQEYRINELSRISSLVWDLVTSIIRKNIT